MVYLVWSPADLGHLEHEEGPWAEVRIVGPGLAVIQGGSSRSAVYHAAKWSLSKGTPLLVTTLTEVPKAKGLAPGWRSWLEQHLDV